LASEKILEVSDEGVFNFIMFSVDDALCISDSLDSVLFPSVGGLAVEKTGVSVPMLEP
jgi:hypothetical protein